MVRGRIGRVRCSARTLPCSPGTPSTWSAMIRGFDAIIDAFSTGGFPLTVAALSLIIRGRVVVVVSSGEEGAGAASAVGLAPAVGRAARAGVEHRCCGPGGRGVAVSWSDLVARLQDLPPRPGHRFRAAAGAAGRAGDQRAVPVAERAVRDRRPAPRGYEHAADRRAARPGAVDDLEGAVPQCCRERNGNLSVAHRPLRAIGHRGMSGAGACPGHQVRFSSSWPEPSSGQSEAGSRAHQLFSQYG